MVFGPPKKIHPPLPTFIIPKVATFEARKLEEKQRMEAERAPHRWAQGLKCSVPVDRLETKAPGDGNGNGYGGSVGDGGAYIHSTNG